MHNSIKGRPVNIYCVYIDLEFDMLGFAGLLFSCFIYLEILRYASARVILCLHQLSISSIEFHYTIVWVRGRAGYSYM